MNAYTLYRDRNAKENCWQAVATEVAADVTGELHIFIEAKAGPSLNLSALI